VGNRTVALPHGQDPSSPCSQDHHDQERAGALR